MAAQVPKGQWHKVVENDNGSLICLDAATPLMVISSEAGNVTRYKRETPIYLGEGGIIDRLMPNKGDTATIDDMYEAVLPHLDNERREGLSNWRQDDDQRNRLGSIVNRWPAYLVRLGFLNKINKRGETWTYERTELTLVDILREANTDSPERAWARRRIADLKAELVILERFLAT